MIWFQLIDKEWLSCTYPEFPSNRMTSQHANDLSDILTYFLLFLSFFEPILKDRNKGSIKDRNDMDLTEAEDIKKRWQEYTEELYKKV